MTQVRRPTTDEACATARELIRSVTYGALAVIDPKDGHPLCSRVALGTAPDGTLIALVSELALHTQALRAHPACSLLIAQPTAKGDPLTHVRMTVQARARFVAHDRATYEDMAAHYLRDHPKSKLYIGFQDFSFLLFEVQRAHLNAGFGKAFTLTANDLCPDPPGA